MAEPINVTRASRQAFTLIELLVVISIIALLALLSSAALNQVSERGRTAVSISNLGQIGAALNAYSADNYGKYPTAAATIAYGEISPQTDLPSWQEQLDPYVGGARKIFAGRRPKLLPSGEFESAYFLGTRAAFEAAVAANDPNKFQAVRQVLIDHPTKYILAGEIATFEFEEKDADRDNYTQEPAFSFSQEKGARLCLLFADGHVGEFDRYDPKQMMVTYSDPVTP